MMKRYTLLFTFAASFLSLRADHFAGGSITTRCTGNNFHDITLQLFRNCGGTPLGQQTLNFSNDCGVIFSQVLGEPISVQDVSPLCEGEIQNSTCNGGGLEGYDLTTYRASVYLSPCTGWRISWSICCRNASLNVQGTPGMYLEATLNNLGGPCYTQPEFVRNSIPLVCVGQAVNYDGSATEPDGHTLRYILIDARYTTPAPTPVTYASGFSGAQPYTGMAIDSITGTITFVPDATGTIVTAVLVREYDEEARLIGTVMRDLLFVASVCVNEVPSASSGYFTEVEGIGQIDDERSLLVCGEGQFCATLTFADSDEDQTLTLTSNVQDVLPGATFTSSGTNPVAAQLCMNNTSLSPGNYQFTVSATDGACPVVGTQEYVFLVTVTTGVSAGENASVEICSNEDPVSLIGLLGGEPATGGSWTGPVGFPVPATFTPGISAQGQYTYTNSSPTGCVASAVVSITVIPADDPECIGTGLVGSTLNALSLHGDAQLPGRIWVGSTNTMDVDLKALSMDGRIVMVKRMQTNGAGTTVDLPITSSGIYLVQATDRSTGHVQVVRLFVP